MNVDAAREAARRPDGKFGEQARAEETGVDLAVATVEEGCSGPGEQVTLAGPVDEHLSWNVVDADDRYPGRFNRYVAERDGARMAITPGNNDSYDAPGFQWEVSVGPHSDSGTAATLDAASTAAAASADYFTSGQAEYEAWADFADED